MQQLHEYQTELLRALGIVSNTNAAFSLPSIYLPTYRGADKSLARPGGNKLQRQKILIFLYPIYNHNWRNISTIYINIYE